MRLLLLSSLWLLLGCNWEQLIAPGHQEWMPPSGAAPAIQPAPPIVCANRNPSRQALFGDLHVHTGLSMDARAREVINGPRDAYRYARGEVILVPPLDAQGQGTRPLQIDRPLDFAAVTDHAEYFAEVNLCTTPSATAYNSKSCQIFRGERQSWFAWLLGLTGWPARALGVMSTDGRSEDICGDGGETCRATAKSVWGEVQNAAEEFYDRSPNCGFTTLVGWEYSRMPGRTKVHRNVFFRNEIVPEMPISWIDAGDEVELWEKLVERCLDSGTACDALTIPHNPNLSGGNIFTLDYQQLPLAAQQKRVALRARLEPIVEMMQIKGESECRNGLWNIVGGPDELCTFEKYRGLGEDAPETCTGTERSFGAMAGKGCISRLDFTRYAVAEGMREAERLGVNPFEVGFIGSTDTHNASPGAVVERDYPGTSGIMDNTIKKRLLGSGGGHALPKDIRRNPGGIAGVWATENSRDAIFDALRRRETFATSGPRIRPRFFSGWDLPANLCAHSKMSEVAYATGVPMGGRLSAPTASDSAPQFLVHALADVGTPQRPGGLLQRIQIIKVWYGNQDTLHQSVFEIAGDPDSGAGVDLATCAPVGSGHRELCAQWEDPDFDPLQRAAYYARIVENPSCRWNSWQCLELARTERPEVCDSPEVPKTIQERAWTSPIWYIPTDT